MHEYSSKPCRTCGEDKPLGEYRRDKYRSDGRLANCKSCMGRGPRQLGTYYFNNSGVCRTCGRGKSEVEFGIDRGAKLGVSTICKECKNEYGRLNSVAHRESKNAVSAARVRNIRLGVLLHYGGIPPMCACCGETYLEFLALDHIGGGGGIHRESIGKTAGHKFHAWLRDNNYPPGFRILCHSCNHATKDGYPCVHADPIWSKDLSGMVGRELYFHNYRMNRRMTILKHYGGDPPECACCGESHSRLLSIDHINGGGYKHWKATRRPLDWIVFHDGFPPDYRILCMNCNLARGFYGRCPHETATVS